VLAQIGLTGGDKKSNTNNFLVCKFSQLGFPLDVKNYFMGFFHARKIGEHWPEVRTE
jgi:hypothetical protein